MSRQESQAPQYGWSGVGVQDDGRQQVDMPCSQSSHGIAGTSLVVIGPPAAGTPVACAEYALAVERAVEVA